jgi:hypothetical protein
MPEVWRMNWREVVSTAVVCLLCALFVVAAFFISSDLNESVSPAYITETK